MYIIGHIIACHPQILETGLMKASGDKNTNVNNNNKKAVAVCFFLKFVKKKLKPSILFEAESSKDDFNEAKAEITKNNLKNTVKKPADKEIIGTTDKAVCKLIIQGSEIIPLSQTIVNRNANTTPAATTP